MRISANFSTAMKRSLNGDGPSGCTLGWDAPGAATAATFWMATNKRRTAPMEKASPANTAPVDEEIEETHTIVTEPSRGRPSLLGEASSFLITLGVRAAENYAVYCLDEWIAPSQVLVARKPGLSSSSDESALPDGRNIRPKRVIGGCEKLGPVLVDGGSEDDRSSS